MEKKKNLHHIHANNPPDASPAVVWTAGAEFSLRWRRDGVGGDVRIWK